jgi:hypothetical protein
MFAPRKLLFPIVLLGLALACLVLFYQTILIGSGKFLAPEVAGKADVLVLEGTELIRERPVRAGMELVASGRANRMVVVVHQDLAGGGIFALQNYARLVARDLEALGLRRDQFQVIEVPTNHPITLTEAQIALTNLSRSGVRSVILMAEGFHARRSFWVYKQVGTPLGMKIYLYPYFRTYEIKAWWRTVDGRYDFIAESLKLFYYVIKGYIPVKSLYTT